MKFQCCLCGFVFDASEVSPDTRANSFKCFQCPDCQSQLEIPDWTSARIHLLKKSVDTSIKIPTPVIAGGSVIAVLVSSIAFVTGGLLGLLLAVLAQIVILMVFLMNYAIQSSPVKLNQYKG